MVDPFSHVVGLILHQPTFPPYIDLLFSGSTPMMLGYQASYSETSCDFVFFFFFQSDRPNIKKRIQR